MYRRLYFNFGQPGSSTASGSGAAFGDILPSLMKIARQQTAADEPKSFNSTSQHAALKTAARSIETLDAGHSRSLDGLHRVPARAGWNFAWSKLLAARCCSIWTAF
jgi:hypothetical protein